jgi:DNA-binding transcriptional MerR regulator
MSTDMICPVSDRRLRAVEEAPAGGPGELTVEQLAYETGMSVRNIRNHQSRGLLPPPEVRARIGYYGPQHVERLRLIQELQAEGFKLTAIKRFLGEQGAAADRFVGLRRAITAPFESESPEVLTNEELAERFGPLEANRKALEKARRLGVLVPLGDGRHETPSPALLRAAEEVIERGVPLDAALAVIERVQRSSRTVARAFVDLFLDELWKPFDEAGRPDERWPEITESIERLRPLASEALLAMFEQTMAAEVEDAFGKVLEQQAKRGS